MTNRHLLCISIVLISFFNYCSDQKKTRYNNISLEFLAINKLEDWGKSEVQLYFGSLNKKNYKSINFADTFYSDSITLFTLDPVLLKENCDSMFYYSAVLNTNLTYGEFKKYISSQYESIIDVRLDNILVFNDTLNKLIHLDTLYW